uniref:Uncharacterized protein n=1 Tax=Caudovirales sp. ctTqA28 TaxID=2826775 RepID=A0A8S5MDF9_9CAUD|nr:MAG TPA: hypothetical protein [Caudovirales sp. ctTqA28]
MTIATSSYLVAVRRLIAALLRRMVFLLYPLILSSLYCASNDALR